MKKLLVFSATIIFHFHSCIFAQTYEWAKHLGGSSSDYGYSITSNLEGDVYITGSFQGTSNFDPNGSYNLISNGANDIFIAKYNANGDFQWAHSIGGPNSDFGFAIATDANGDLYVSGSFQGTADFDPSSNTYNLTAAGNSDIFILKYDANGNFIWAKSIGSTGNDIAKAMVVKNDGTIYLTGSYQGTTDFNPGATACNLTSNGGSDAFFASYDSDGLFKFAKSVGGSNSDFANAIDVDAAGNIYIAGYFYGAADFNPGTAVNLLSSSGAQDIFIAKFDSSGDYVWAKNMGGSSSDVANALTIDSNGNLIIAGYFNGVADFDPNTGIANITSVGSQDMFLAKYSANGNYMWAFNIGSTGVDAANAIVTDASNNIYLTGSFSGTTDFNPGSALKILTPIGNTDAFVAKYTTTGEFIWVNQIGGANNEESYSICTNLQNNINITGYFSGITNFDSNLSSSANLVSAGSTDVFIANYLQTVTTAIPTFSSNKNDLFSIYPNPANDFAVVQFIGDYKNVILQISNAIGQTISKTNYSNQSSVVIDMSNFSKGVYIISTQTIQGTSRLKLIKQ